MIWYCVFTNSKAEEIADKYLRAAGYETLFLGYKDTYRHATRKPIEIIAPVYPRYLFVALAPSQGLYRVQKTQGVHSVVTFGDSPAEIPPEIIESERARIGQDGLVWLPKEEKKLRKRLRQGDRITLQYGGSTGHQGTVIIDSGQVIRLDVEGKRVTALPEQVSPGCAARTD